MKYDFIVIGGGIAGVAISELLQRSGKSVLLLEENNTLCSLSSAQQQGWLHTGALYAALPTNQYFRMLVGNLDDLFNYYSVFDRMNFKGGRCLVPGNPSGWFNNSTNFYFYTSPNDPVIPLWLKPLWFLAIIRAQARLSWFETLDFSKDIVPQMNHLNFDLHFSRIISHRNFPIQLEHISTVLKSRDRSMNSEYIISDLIASYLSHGGKIKLATKIATIEKGKVSDTNDNSYRATNIVLTAGKGIKELSNLNLKIVKSPLLVIKPALTDINFIKMHPIISETLNHIYHKTPEGDYSVIGNATYYDPNDPIDEDKIHGLILDKMNKVFNLAIDKKSTSLYFGYKTELTDLTQLRNYQYHIIESDNYTIAVPGKMTLAFSLAVNVCRHFGIDPCVQFSSAVRPDPSIDICRPTHYQKFLGIASD